jgi:hypothetical protein
MWVPEWTNEIGIQVSLLRKGSEPAERKHNCCVTGRSTYLTIKLTFTGLAVTYLIATLATSYKRRQRALQSTVEV